MNTKNINPMTSSCVGCGDVYLVSFGFAGVVYPLGPGRRPVLSKRANADQISDFVCSRPVVGREQPRIGDFWNSFGRFMPLEKNNNAIFYLFGRLSGGAMAIHWRLGHRCWTVLSRCLASVVLFLFKRNFAEAAVCHALGFWQSTWWRHCHPLAAMPQMLDCVESVRGFCCSVSFQAQLRSQQLPSTIDLQMWSRTRMI